MVPRKGDLDMVLTLAFVHEMVVIKNQICAICTLNVENYEKIKTNLITHISALVIGWVLVVGECCCFLEPFLSFG